MSSGQVLINGEPGTSLPVSDRGLAFGDGIFETVLIRHGRPILLERHLARLNRGLNTLSIALEESLVSDDVETILIRETPVDAVLKILCTRGQGGRGYRSAAGLSPTRILSLHPLPPALPSEGIKAFLCRQTVGHQPALAGIKHLNRLEQVLASQEWPDDSFHEGLMFDAAGFVIEGTRSNVLVSTDGHWLTPNLDKGGIAGVMREHLLDLWGGRLQVANIDLPMLRNADEICFCNSVTGVMPVRLLRDYDHKELVYFPGALCAAAQQAFQDLISA